MALDSIDFNIRIFKSIDFQSSPSAVIAAEGEVFSAMCNVKFDPEMSSASVVWDKNGVSVNELGADRFTVSESRPPNAKSQLRIRDVQKSDAGVYTCRATQFAKTISQIKQHDINIRVQYKPKFPENTPSDVWINKDELEANEAGTIEMDITCLVDADPPATITWYDPSRHQQVDKNRPSGEVISVTEKENMSVLRIRYKGEVGATGNAHGGNYGAANQWPPSGNQYERPNGRTGGPIHSRSHPERSYECRAKNDLGSTSQRFTAKVGDLPPAPRIVSYTFDDNNLTLTIEEGAVEPALDYYRIEITNGVSIEFNATGKFEVFYAIILHCHDLRDLSIETVEWQVVGHVTKKTSTQSKC